MAVDGMKFLVQLRKLTIRTIRTSSRSVRNHPFFVGILLLVLFLYRSSPFLFSLLVSASPVLVCTAVLLGTLLSFGNPQIPEIEKEENISCEISSLRTVSGSNSTTVLQKESVVFDREHSGDKDVEDSAFVGDVCSVSRFEQCLLTPQNSREIVFEQKSAVVEANTECTSREVEFTKENDEETVAFESEVSTYKVQEGSIVDHMDDHFESENHEEPPTFEGMSSPIEVQEKGFENDAYGEGSDDGHMDDHVESSSVPWTRVNGDHDDEDEDEDDEEEEDDEDSGSDGAESSSPDPSMADIIPLLDELHPLIECENLIPAKLPHEDSGMISNRSHSSHVSSSSSDEESDHKEAEEEVGDDDDEDEEENRADKEDGEKSAITWTADDQKNLMDLGSLELERNQRLESLIARRRARKNMRTMTERNLIDLDDFDLPFPVAPISTTRQNPFDFPNDTYDNMGLPPIPGSAPSTMLRGRNPFDLPYDSGEEKPDLMGDSFQQEFMITSQKEPVFRRHESFHIGSSSSSSFEFPRQDARELNRASRFKPYFIPERLPSGSSHSSFMRQSSELSESPSPQRQTSELSGSSSFLRQSSDLSESKASSATETEPVCVEVDQEEMKVHDHDSTEERTPDPEIDRASEHVELGSQSSDNLDDHIDKRDFDLHMPEIRLGESETYVENLEMNLGSRGNDRDVDSWVSEARDLAASTGNIEGEMHLMASPIEDKHYSSSSSSSSSLDDHNDVKEGFHLTEKSVVQTENICDASDCHHHESRPTHSAERSPLETIEEEHIISPSSSSASEEQTATESLKLDEALMFIQHIKPDADITYDFQTEQALDAPNSGFSMDLEETHPKDPVYDLSPQASKINLNISSEELADLVTKDLKQERDEPLQENDGDTDDRVQQEDPILSVVEERRVDTNVENSFSAQADLFSAANELPEEPILGHEDALLSNETGVYLANVVDAPGNFEEKLISDAEKDSEGDFVKDPPPSDYEEEPAVTPERLEEVSSTNKLQTKIYPEMNDLLGLPLQNVGTSSGVQELAQEPVSDLIDFEEHVERRSEFEFVSTVGDAEARSLFTGSFVPEEDMSHEIEEMDEALLSELDAVGDFHVTELQTALTEDGLRVDETNAGPIPEALFINEGKIEAENIEAGFEPIENIFKSNDENAEKSAHDDFSINEVQPEMQNAEASMGEFTDSHVLEREIRFDALQRELIENVKETGDEVAEKSAPDVLVMNTFESKLEDAETSIAELPESHVLETVTMFHVPEPEAGSIEGSESVIKTDELITFCDNTSELEKESDAEMSNSATLPIDAVSEPHFSEISNVIEKDESDTEINDSVLAMEDEIESSSVAAIDVSSDSRVSEHYTVTEKDEPADELNDCVASMEEDIERSSFAAVGVSLDSHASDVSTVIEKDESDTEINDSVLAMEDEIESSSVAAIDVSSDSRVSECNTAIEKDEPADEINECVASMEEETENSSFAAVGVSLDSHASDISTVIEKDDPADNINDSVPPMEEGIQSSAFTAIDMSSDSDVPECDTVIEKDDPAEEIDDFVLVMEEETESSSVADTDVSSDSHVSEIHTVTEKDEPADEINDSIPSMEEEVESSSVAAIDMPSESRVSEINSVIEKDEPAVEINDSVPSMEEDIESSSVAAIDVPSDSHVSEINTSIEKDEPAVELNDFVPSMDEEIESSSVAAIDTSIEKDEPAIEINDFVPEIESSSVAAIDASTDSHISETNAGIEKDEQAVEINDFVPATEEETESSSFASIDVSADSHVSEINTLIENDDPAVETNDFVHVIEEEIESSPVVDIDATTADSRASEINTVMEKDLPAVEINELAPAMEEEIKNTAFAAIDASLDSHVSEINTVIAAVEIDNFVLAREEEVESSTVAAIDVSPGSHASEMNTMIKKDEPASETNESVPSMEEEIERSAFDISSDSKEDALIKDEQPAAETNETFPGIQEEIETKDVQEKIDDHQA